MQDGTQERTTLADLDDTVRQVVADEADLIREDVYPDDSLHEIADGTVPVDTATLYQIAADRPDAIEPYTSRALARGAEPDSASELIAQAIYWYLYETANEEYERLAA